MGKPSRKKNLDYESEEEGSDLEISYENRHANQEEFISLENRYLHRRQAASDDDEDEAIIEDTVANDLEDLTGLVDAGANQREEARDAWGRKAAAFYASGDEESSEEEADDDAMELALKEARQIQLERLAALTAADFESNLDYIRDGAEEQQDTSGDATAGLKDDAIALDVLLSTLSTREKSTVSTDDDFKARIANVLSGLCQQYRALLTNVRVESLPYLNLVAQGYEDALPRFQESAKAFLKFQLQIALWFGLILTAIETLGDLTPSMMMECQTLLKAGKKLKKLRSKFGEVELLALRKILADLQEEVAEDSEQAEEVDEAEDSEEVDDATTLKTEEGEDIDIEQANDDDDASTEVSSDDQLKAVGSSLSQMSRIQQAEKLVESRVVKLEKRKSAEKRKLLERITKIASQKRGSRSSGRRPAADRPKSSVEGSTPSEKKSDQRYGREPDQSGGLDRKYKEEIDKEVENIIADKAAKKERKEKKLKKSLQIIAPVPQELDASQVREINKTIQSNRGLTRKRKKYEGNARVHNKIKYARKLKKLTGTTLKAGDQTASGEYWGEERGINPYVRRSQKLAH